VTPQEPRAARERQAAKGETPTPVSSPDRNRATSGIVDGRAAAVVSREHCFAKRCHDSASGWEKERTAARDFFVAHLSHSHSQVRLDQTISAKLEQTVQLD
jgi:hypothetical protein